MLRPISRNSSIYSHGSNASTSLLIPTSASALNKNVAECIITANLFLEFHTEITTLVKLLGTTALIAVGLMDGLVVVNTLTRKVIRRITTNAPVVCIESCDCESSTEEQEGGGGDYISLLFTTTSSSAEGDSVVYIYNDDRKEVIPLHLSGNHSYSISYNSSAKSKEYSAVIFVTSSSASNAIQLYSRNSNDESEVQLLTREYFPSSVYGRILKVAFINSSSTAARKDPLMLICMENGCIILYNYYTQTIVKNISTTTTATTASTKGKADDYYIHNSQDDSVIICCVHNNSSEIKVLKYHNYNFTQLYDVKTGGKFRVKSLQVATTSVDGKVLLFVIPSSNYKSKLLYGATSASLHSTTTRRELISPVIVYHNGRISNEIVLKDDHIKGQVSFNNLLYCGSKEGKGLGYLSCGREMYEFRMK